MSTPTQAKSPRLLALLIRWEQGFLPFMPSQPPFATYGPLQDLKE
ncbi:predicted protein [Botrytis cinerea T4]|uniref:Uncharacterized protein n=1 Tax=Botryotinia fuckeliana (strain T4) TaxID=999810 RepID=G2YVT3_BOTF4|nr:predicted protein [Botrytis cinerea T4]